jgi:hypothetical protein
MNRRFMLLILFLCTIVLATVVFGATVARSGSNNQAHMVPIASRNQPLSETGPEAASDISGRLSANQTALGFYQSPGIQLGSTSNDLQHNSRMARQVAVGANGRVHFVWTNAPLPFDAAQRSIFYTWFEDGELGEALNLSAILEPAKTRGGYSTVDVFQNRALVVNHYGANPITTSALEISSGSSIFTAEDPPANVINCENINCGSSLFNGYIWPVVAADQDGSGKLVIHIAAGEGNTNASYSAITYFRGVSSGVTMELGMYGTCGTFIDSVSGFAYDIAEDPNTDMVVIAYPKAREENRENNDLAYRLSTDLGATWGPVVNLTNFPTESKERCGQEVSVLFAADNCFHILWLGTNYDSVGNSISDQEVRLYHWSSCYPTARSLVLDARNHDDSCHTAAFEYSICKINLTQCHSTSLGKDLLYAVYSRQLGTTSDPDCSALGYFNQEVFISPSSTWGETWGEPVNLTNTKTNDCLGGACADDGSSSSARYVTDSLRIEYLEDLDAGSSVLHESSTAWLLNPIKFISCPCIDMGPYQILTCTPDSIGYPFHATTHAIATQDLLLVNGGNQSIDWTSSIIDGGEGWISVPASGTIQAGYINSSTITATVGPKNNEGLYQGTIRFTYDSGTKTLDVPVDFYVFGGIPEPFYVDIHTAKSRLMVSQAGQAADDIVGSSFSFFAADGEDFITDASLILGNSRDNLSWLIFNSVQGAPTVANPFGLLYALSNMTVDSTTFPGNFGYTVAYGRGTNRDSTVGFDVRWYAPHHPDSADFYIGHFEVYKGMNNPTGTVTGLDIAFGCDWDVPSDTNSDNAIGTDPARQMIYLQGEYSTARRQGFAASAAYREDGVPIPGGFAWGNQQQVYSQGGYMVDSVWKYMELTNSYTSPWNDSIGDMSIVMVIAKNYTVTPTSRLKFDVVLAAKRAEDNPAGLPGLNLAVDKAKDFIIKYERCTSCGDCNSDGSIDISDVVCLIARIFSGGAAPGWCNYDKGKGDANGDGRVDISDAVFLIAHIFAGGPAPHCQGM